MAASTVPMLAVMLIAILVVTIAPLNATQSRRAQQWAFDTFDLDRLHQTVDGTGVVIAVLDTDIAASHQDLLGVLLPGFDFIEDRPFDPLASDRQLAASDHGTMVASIIAAPRDGVGITGIAPGARILPVRVVPDVGQGTPGDMASGIDWAIENGAEIINVSIRTSFDATAVRQAVERASDAGVVIVASAGLAPTDVPFYPAAYDSVISVAALTPSLEAYTGSPVMSYVDVAAPGSDVIGAGGSAVSAYRFGSGTSFAAPHVTGLLALMRQYSPTSSALELRKALEAHAADLGLVGRDDVFGMGLIDPAASLANVRVGVPRAPEFLLQTGFGNRLLLNWPPSRSLSLVGYEVLLGGEVVESVDAALLAVLVRRPGPSSELHYSVRAVDALGLRSDATAAPTATAGKRSSILVPDSIATTSFLVCENCFPRNTHRF